MVKPNFSKTRQKEKNNVAVLKQKVRHGHTAIFKMGNQKGPAAAAASLQSCPTLCDPIDGSPPGSPVPGIFSQEYWSGLPFPSPMRESEVAQSCPTLSDLMDCSLPGSSVHGIFQAKVLLYSKGNPAQCYMAARMGGELGGEWIHVIYMTESLSCSPETITTLLIGYTPI